MSEQALGRALVALRLTAPEDRDSADFLARADTLLRQLEQSGAGAVSMGVVARLFGPSPFVTPQSDPAEADIPEDRLIYPSRGGVIIRTSAGLIQIGVPMWTNKDAFELFLQSGGFSLAKEEIPHKIPTVYIHDPKYTGVHNGLTPFDFLGYMYFVTKGLRFSLVVPDGKTATDLASYLNLSYQGPRLAGLSELAKREYPEGAYGVPDLFAEITRGFASPEPEALREVLSFDEKGVFQTGEVTIVRRGDQVYDVYEKGRCIGRLDLKKYPMPVANLERQVKLAFDPEFQKVRMGALMEGRPGLWPIGTAHGFAPREETSGFMIWNRGRILLVDPPSSTLEYMIGNGIPLDLVDGVIVTHGHTDHYGNAIPQLLEALPRVRLYTTGTIYRMLQEQYRLALGGDGLDNWNFVEVTPQKRTEINGLDFKFDYSFHPVPALGLEIWVGNQLALYFTGDTFADQSIMAKAEPGSKGEPPVMSRERALRILRHYAYIPFWAGARQRPYLLVEAGIPPIHIRPDVTKAYLNFLEHLGIDTSRVLAYHVSNEVAAQAGLKKWEAGHRGWIDLGEFCAETDPLVVSGEVVGRAVKRIPLFSEMTRTEQAELIKLGSLESFQAGQPLIGTDGDPDSFFVIVDGAVDISVDGARIAQIQSGLVGEGALLDEPRNAVVTAAVLTTALRFSAKNDAVRGFFEEGRYIDTLRQIRESRAAAHPAFDRSPWRGLPFEIRTALFQIGEIGSYKDGEVFIGQGDDSRDVFVVLEGKVAIEKDGRRIAEGGPGDMVGEMALVNNAPRSATVSAVGPVSVIRFSATLLQVLQDRFPGIGAPLLRLSKERARSR